MVYTPYCRREVMVGRVTLVLIGLAVFGFIFDNLRHATTPAGNALSIVAGNRATSTEMKGTSVLRGGSTGTSVARLDDLVCRWSGRDVVVSAHITNISPQRVTMRWQPRYQLQTGTVGGTNPALEQVRKLAPHQAITVEAKDRPKGVPPGTGIIVCGTPFYTTPP